MLRFTFNSTRASCMARDSLRDREAERERTSRYVVNAADILRARDMPRRGHYAGFRPSADLDCRLFAFGRDYTV